MYTMDKPFMYGLGVKITNWDHRMLGYPLDTPNPKNAVISQYKTLGDNNLVTSYRTTAQDVLDPILNFKYERKDVVKPLMTFGSFSMNDFRFDSFGERQPDYIESYQTSYRIAYKSPKPIVKKIDCCSKVIDPLMYRRPKNDFEMLPSSENKFMDDHFVNQSQCKLKINFLRQLYQNQSQIRFY